MIFKHFIQYGTVDYILEFDFDFDFDFDFNFDDDM